MWFIPHGAIEGSVERPQGVITYVKSSDDTDALVWLDKEARHRHRVTIEQILKRGEMRAGYTGHQARHPLHHDLVLARAYKRRRKKIISPCHRWSTGPTEPHPPQALTRALKRLPRLVCRADMNRSLAFRNEIESAAMDDVYQISAIGIRARDKLNNQLRV